MSCKKCGTIEKRMVEELCVTCYNHDYYQQLKKKPGWYEKHKERVRNYNREKVDIPKDAPKGFRRLNKAFIKFYKEYLESHGYTVTKRV